MIMFLALACNNFKQAEPGQPTANLVSQEIEVPEEPQYLIGETAPDFTLADLSGNTVNPQNLRGKIVVIHFATTWCPFCNVEAPYLEKI